MRAEHGVKVEDDATKQQGEVFRNRGRAWAFRYYHADSVRRTKGGFATKTEASEARKRKLEELAAPVRRDLSVRELVGSTSTSTSPRRTRSTFSATGSTNMSFRLSATCRWSGCG